jgi:hypothetical protein
MYHIFAVEPRKSRVFARIPVRPQKKEKIPVPGLKSGKIQHLRWPEMPNFTAWKLSK